MQPSLKIKIISNLCSALAKLEAKGLIHNNLIPENVMINHDLEVKLCGLTKCVDDRKLHHPFIYNHDCVTVKNLPYVVPFPLFQRNNERSKVLEQELKFGESIKSPINLFKYQNYQDTSFEETEKQKQMLQYGFVNGNFPRFHEVIKPKFKCQNDLYAFGVIIFNLFSNQNFTHGLTVPQIMQRTLFLKDDSESLVAMQQQRNDSNEKRKSNKKFTKAKNSFALPKIIFEIIMKCCSFKYGNKGIPLPKFKQIEDELFQIKQNYD